MSLTNSTTQSPGENYVVGDIQGCCDELSGLLKQVNFDASKDHLWLTGDLVARGPKSLETLRLVKSLENSATTVLGNHDLHLLATYHGIKKIKPNDKLDALFAAPDLDELIDWLKQQPMLAVINDQQQRKMVMTHAGIWPHWSLDQAKAYANEVESILRGEQCIDYLTHMYQNTPTYWQENLSGYDRYCFIVNSFTRMRFCSTQGDLDFEHKSHPDKVKDQNLVPWFNLAPIWSEDVVFGHWASLMGQCHRSQIFSLDTGCVWGNHLTMLRVSDHKRFTQSYLNNIAL
jgi:bis(5'-nucleosyl)-tetraphosphatase (symmetrical)